MGDIESSNAVENGSTATVDVDQPQLADALDLLCIAEGERGLKLLAREPGVDFEPRRELGVLQASPGTCQG